MKILALDTSTEVCSVALKVEHQIFTTYDDSGVKNTDIILPMINQLIQQAGIKQSELDLITFARGPGGFTGVRVATGVAQGIAFGLDIPVVPVSTLAMLALRAYKQTEKKHIYVINDARMKEVYVGCFELNANDSWTMLVDEAVIKPDVINMPEKEGLIVGSGWDVYQDVLSPLIDQSKWSINTKLKPHAEDLLEVAEHLHTQGQSVAAEDALPVYLRNNVAKKKGER